MQEPSPNTSIEKTITDSGLAEALCDGSLNPAGKRQQTSTLIEFPGTSRPLPEWRKQLSQRVREVQERRAREAAEEAAAAREAGVVSCSLPSGQLELVPALDQPVINPIVSKALERLDRARRSEPVPGGFTRAAAAAAFEPDANIDVETEVIDAPPVEAKPKLTVVAPSKSRTETSERKPVRVISDGVDDVALSYLETCLSVPAIEGDTRNDSAGFVRRSIAGIFDLLLVALMAAPAAAAIEFSDGNWSDPRVIGLMGGITVVTLFAYFTISIALTGRTLAMRIFSLRTIDIRTGLIPTGGQAMKGAFGYIFALVLVVGLLYAVIDPDGRTISDRFSKTIVIRD
ncbi:MAG: hypothetical protein QOG23_5738 [Blastocatellia bacterium]|jgi:uncharacterized RDD family membrane protein YckC|nr:hypothetical protein [Blastocatellia bacterium]